MYTNILKRSLALSILLFIASLSSAKQVDKQKGIADTSSLDVPLAGNAFLTSKPAAATEQIRNNGLINWSNPASIVSVYFRVKNSGRINLKLRAKVPSVNSSSKIRITLSGTSKEIDLSGTEVKDYEVGVFSAPSGYVQVDLQGVSKTGQYFGDVSHLLIEGEVDSNDFLYANDPAYYYWARRGPSCHMAYTIPSSDPIEYYYGELTVPEGQDAIGSYFMSNGFSEGYFGIQVNSATERRVLFSVWSPFATDNPADIPEHLRVKLNRKGKEVHTGEFGNEGSGGQSFLRYNWTAGNTYRFLLKGKPDGNGATDFTAWIYLSDQDGWSLIASWKRPELSKNLTGFHSFLENFDPNNGHLGRKVLFSNRWVRTACGNWLPIQSAKFTVDATYHAKQRIDAIGGVLDDEFYLQNGGFFSTIVAPNSVCSVHAAQDAPKINFDALP